MFISSSTTTIGSTGIGTPFLTTSATAATVTGVQATQTPGLEIAIPERHGNFWLLVFVGIVFVLCAAGAATWVYEFEKREDSFAHGGRTTLRGYEGVVQQKQAYEQRLEVSRVLGETAIGGIGERDRDTEMMMAGEGSAQCSVAEESEGTGTSCGEVGSMGSSRHA